MSSVNMTRVYSSAPKPFHFTKLQEPHMSPMPSPATYSKPKRKRGGAAFTACCCCCFTTLCSLLITMILVLGVATLIVWLVLRPIYAPDYSLVDAEINTLSYSTTSNSLDANFLYTINATNRNAKIGFKYDVINLDTSYSGADFGQSSIPGFYNGHRNTTTISSSFNVTGFALTPTLGTSFLNDVKNSSIPLQLRVSVKARIKVGLLTTFPFWVHANCDGRVSPPTATGSGKLLSKSCSIVR